MATHAQNSTPSADPPIDESILEVSDLCPCQKELLDWLDRIVDRAAMIAWLAASGDIGRALRVTALEWNQTRLQHLPNFTVTPSELQRLTCLDWQRTITLGFTPSEPRHLSLLHTTAIKEAILPRNLDTHWVPECQHTIAGTDLDAVVSRFPRRFEEPHAQPVS